MHILFITDNFPPEVNAPASRTFEHCAEWVKAGVQVTVITCAPNFPKGRVYAGYRNRLWSVEEMSGIRVIRVWSYITANEGFLRRTLDYVSFMVSAVVAGPTIRRVDVVVGTSPQFFSACAAYLVAGYKRVPWVFELRDLWPESIRAVGAMSNEAVLRALERIELFLYRRASIVISVTRAFKDVLIKRGIPGDKIQVVTNGVDVSRFTPRPKDLDLVAELSLQGKFVVGYIGTHGLAHALETVLKAARLISTDADGDRYRFLFLGEGANKTSLQKQAAQLGLDNVVFVDSVPKEQVVRYWSLLDASIIHLKRTDLFTTVIPSKLFECMGMAVPVIHGVAGESAQIVLNEGVGVAFEPENEEALCAAIRGLASDPALYATLKQNGPPAAKRYDRKVLAGNMLSILRAVARG
jgi:glycosyltransferase involved in cell wall biosynthesis